MPLSILRTVDATLEPVTTSQAKAHMRITDTAEDSYIESLITAARQHAEHLTERAFITQTWTMTLDRFPDYFGDIRLPKPLLISVSSITYVDLEGTTQTLSSSLYEVDARSQPGRIRPAYGQAWPSTREQLNAVTITYTAGYGATAASVPTAIKQAIMIVVAHWFEHREPVITGTIVAEVPMSATALLGPYRVANCY